MSSGDLLQNTQSYSAQYSEIFGCSHLNRVAFQEKQFCQQCGMYINNPSTRVFKTLKMKFNAFFDPQRVLSICMQSKVIPTSNQFRINAIEFLEQAADRLRLSNNTIFLAMIYLDELFTKQVIGEQQIYLYASTALMLAAKATELDERIPFISKLKRYASMTNHPEINQYRTEDFKMAERVLIQTMDWKLQQVTLIDRVEALLSFGVIDDDDSLGSTQTQVQSSANTPQKENKNEELKQSKIEITHQKLRDLQEQQILHIVKEIENKYSELLLTMLKESIYFQTDQNILALSCVAYLRKKAGLLNIWSQQLQSITGVSAQKISSTVSQIMTIMSKNPHKLLRTTTQHSYLENVQHYQSASNTPTAVPQNSFPYNTQTNRFLFDGPKKTNEPQYFNLNTQQKLHTNIYPSQSTLCIPKNELRICDSKNKKPRNSNYTYLNINENVNHPTFLPHSNTQYFELDKKYEQAHKVSGNGNSMLRPKLFQPIQ